VFLDFSMFRAKGSNVFKPLGTELVGEQKDEVIKVGKKIHK
jgi:hypothetical protein